MHTQKAELSQLPELPGIDCAEGLARAMDDEALYASVLRDFLTRYRTAPQELSDARAAEDYPRIQFLVHKLKGIIGTIGARDTFFAAEQLESSWSEVTQPPFDTPAYDLFYFRLSGLLTTLSAAEEAIAQVEAGPDSTIVADGDALTSELPRLIALLDDSDTEALSLYHSLKSPLSAIIEPQVADEVDRAIEDFQFEEASRLLKDANSSLDSTQGEKP